MGTTFALALLFSMCPLKAQVGALVAGQITDRGKGEGLRKATVAATLLGPRSTTVTAKTDAEGKFLFPELDAGTYRVMASAPGYETLVFGASAPDQPGRFVMLGPGETRLDVNIALRATGVVTGTVTDDEGDPVKHAQVALLRTVYERGKSRTQAAYHAQTDDRGRYRAFNVRPGKYYVMASSQAHRVARPHPEAKVGEGFRPAAYGLRFYPNHERFAGAQLLQVPSGGEVRGVDFRLPLLQTVTLRGRVQPPPGVQLGSPIEITVMSEDAPGQMSFAIGVQAAPPAFQFQRDQVRPGRYQITASAVIDGRQYRSEQSIEIGPQGADGLTLSLDPPVDLKGTLVMEGDAGADRPNIRLSPGSPGSHVPPAPAVFDGPAFTIRSVPAGLWDIDVNPIPEGGYLKGMWLGEQDVLHEDMLLKPGNNAALRIVVSTRGARVEGDVAIPETEGGRQAAVLLKPEAGRERVLSLYSFENTTPDGHFILDGLTPGKYRIFAFEEMNARSFQDPDYLKPIAELGKEIELKEGDSLRLSEKLPMISVAQLPAEE